PRHAAAPQSPGILAPRSPGLTTTWPNGSPVNTSNDPQVASSSWMVGVLTWDQIAFYDKAGNLMPQTATFQNPTQTETLFAPVVNFLDSKLNLNPATGGDPSFLLANGQVGDARIEFDSFRKRWIILATAKNVPNSKFSTALKRSQRRTKLLLAISVDE